MGKSEMPTHTVEDGMPIRKDGVCNQIRKGEMRMNRQERRDLFYVVAVFDAVVKKKTEACEGKVAEAAASLFEAAARLLKVLGEEMDAGEKRAAKNQVKYKTLKVVTTAARTPADERKVEIDLDDLNTLFAHGREECVLCEKTGGQISKCKVRQVLRRYNLPGVCEK